MPMGPCHAFSNDVFFCSGGRSLTVSEAGKKVGSDFLGGDFPMGLDGLCSQMLHGAGIFTYKTGSLLG